VKLFRSDPGRGQKLPVDPMVDTPGQPCPKWWKDAIPEKDVMGYSRTLIDVPQIVGKWLDEDQSLYGKVFPITLDLKHDDIRTWAFTRF
jgi:hypothetical protein